LIKLSCFGFSEPKREPVPEAGIMVMIFFITKF
jgi:hypothetical protein